MWGASGYLRVRVCVLAWFYGDPMVLPSSSPLVTHSCKLVRDGSENAYFHPHVSNCVSSAVNGPEVQAVIVYAAVEKISNA